MVLAIFFFNSAFVTLGCEHPQDRNVEASSAPARSSSVDASVVERLTHARCDREQFCGNVADGKKYATRDVCKDSFRSSIGNDLNSYQCPGGLNGSAVDQCLSAISSEECGAHPIEAITRVDRCRKGAMCMQ
jgi:Family of unknown function (DUF6184)